MEEVYKMLLDAGGVFVVFQRQRDYTDNVGIATAMRDRITVSSPRGKISIVEVPGTIRHYGRFEAMAIEGDAMRGRFQEPERFHSAQTLCRAICNELAPVVRQVADKVPIRE